MSAIFKSSLLKLSPLPTSHKAKPLDKPNFFVNTAKAKPKVLADFGRNLRQKSQL